MPRLIGKEGRNISALRLLMKLYAKDGPNISLNRTNQLTSRQVCNPFFMARVTSGTGKGGKSFQDRKLAADVRTKALNDIYAVLKGQKSVEKWSLYKKAVLLKLSASILPRLNEHTGASGSPLFYDDETKAKARHAWEEALD